MDLCDVMGDFHSLRVSCAERGEEMRIDTDVVPSSS
jgi:hypothetical protein